MSTGARGPAGEHGDQGERGPAGDHGQMGDTGQRGMVGQTGPRGERGPTFAPLILRHITKAFLLLLAGVVVALWVAWSAIQDAEDVAHLHCEAGNDRSHLQLEDFAESARLTASLDLERLLGITPESAAEFRSIHAERTRSRIERLPFFDCDTGQRVPAPIQR